MTPGDRGREEGGIETCNGVFYHFVVVVALRAKLLASVGMCLEG